ncbi:glycoside hydrolase family 2 protein [Microbacterium sp. YY-01]|uniref:glycoside hydrolase family 2 protein n=1 Tax=Microbacterium sp. YY-01 TaxID=3421634 RepID=UPI003D16367C
MVRERRELSLSSASGQVWMLHPVRLADGAPEIPHDIAASVPGVVHTDLLAAHLIDDPYVGVNEPKSAWIGRSDWAYRTRIDASGLADAERVELVFDGLDTVATVRLDGAVIAQTANQHRTYRWDVTEQVRAAGAAGCLLEVEFADVWAHAEALRDQLGDRPNDYPTPGNFVRKMAANFGWDWGPQLVTAGVWRDVRLEAWSRARLATVVPQVDVHEHDGVRGVGTVRVTTTVDMAKHSGAGIAGIAGIDGAGMSVQATLTAAHGTVEVSAQATIAEGRAIVDLAVDDVALWWPQGAGAQPLYRLQVQLVDAEGAVLDRRIRNIGFRRIELDTTPDAAGAAFTFRVNGVPIFVRGANWIPEDCFPSRITPEWYARRVNDAREANLNLLRVWGGGIYESEDFYDACDERGIMVWQDFLFACATYPEEEPLRSEVEAEARDNVARLAGRASLVLWNGNNENIWGWHDWGWQRKLAEAPGGTTWGMGYYTQLLPSVVAEIDPATPYWAGSPYSGSPDIHPNDPGYGTMHVWDVWNRVDYRRYADYRPRFSSEYGFQGPATWATIVQGIEAEPQHPDSEAMLLHQKAPNGNDKIARGMLPHLPQPRDFAEWHYLAQVNQARAVEFGTGWWRTLRPHCMGTVMWQLNDCWPVTSWAAVDGYGRRKPLWHAVRRVNALRWGLIRRTDHGLSLFVVNDGDKTWQAEGELVRRRFDNVVYAREHFSAPVEPQSLVEIPLSSVMSGVRDTGYEIISAHIVGLERPIVFSYVDDVDMGLADGPVEVDVAPWHEGQHRVTLRAEHFVRGASLFPDRIAPDAWVSDVDLDLFAGEPVAVTVHSSEPLDPDALAATLRTLNPLVAAARA